MSANEPISTNSEWDFELIERYDQEIARIAKNFDLDTYPNQIEVITAEQMLDAYSSVGMPINYHHWSYGKQFVHSEKNYRRGYMGLAYEIVINSNPCIAYLMEENTITLQALVIAHASYGHNSFFKNNYLFKSWTNADSIIDYLVFARKYINNCENKYGFEVVEEFLDACHSLMNYGVDRYKRPPKLSLREESIRQKLREEYLQSQVNDLWRTIPKQAIDEQESTEQRFPAEPQENILYFLEKNAPLLEPWQREILRIVRKISQYFYPQKQTKVMNEGWACFWHYHLINQLYDENLVTDDFMIEFAHHHTNVVYQPPFDSHFYSGLNPYTLGFNIFMDIKRICVDPTDEDREWFPDIAGKDWLEITDFAMRNFKDESFIAQYLSPKVIRDMKLFTVLDDDSKDNLEISAIHNDAGYQHVRNTLSNQYNLANHEPNIQVYAVDVKGNRSLTLRHQQHERMPLAQSTSEVLKHLHYLWGFDVHIDSVTSDGKIAQSYSCPVNSN